MRSLYLCVLSLVSSVIMVQTTEGDELWMESDRPGMATGVDVMPFKSVQWEKGIQYDYASGAHSLECQCRAWRSMDD